MLKQIHHLSCSLSFVYIRQLHSLSPIGPELRELLIGPDYR
jgi:hypothetical protein